MGGSGNFDHVAAGVSAALAQSIPGFGDKHVHLRFRPESPFGMAAGRCKRGAAGVGIDAPAAMAALNIQRREAKFRITICHKSEIVNVL